MLVHPHQQALVAQACLSMESSEAAPALATLARAAGLSAHHFHRLFKRVTGLTPKQYQQAVRTRRTQDSLAQGSSVTEAIYAAGFNTASRFYASSDALLGMAPSAFRKGGAGQDIRYAVQACALGQVLVAATARGVCAIELGDTPQTLIQRLQARFPQARVAAADALFSDWLAQTLRYIAHPQGVLDLPLDIQGTVFQRRVWQALQQIPCGQTASYAEVARRLGQPQAVRAVAGACAANPVALAIPCHRVLRSDGSLSGYRWGVQRKEELLRREAQAGPQQQPGRG